MTAAKRGPNKLDRLNIRAVPTAERGARIAAALAAGELTLHEAVAECYLGRVPMPPEVGGALLAVFEAYYMGRVKDLAEGLGMAEPFGTRAARAKRSYSVETQKAIVDELHKTGWPLSPPGTAKEDNTAFHIAGQYLGLAPATVARNYYGKRKKAM